MAAHSNIMGGSNASRRMNCYASYRLELEAPEPPASKFAVEGTFHHDVIEQHFNGKSYAELEGYTRDGFTLTQEYIRELHYPAVAAWQQLLKKYGVEEVEYMTEARVSYPGVDAFGTVDVLGTSDEYTIIGDWKFGRGVRAGPSALEYQLPFYAAAARVTPDCSDMFSPDKKIIVAAIQPAMDMPLSDRVMEYDEVVAFEKRVRDTILIMTAGEALPPTAGKHCRWCRAAALCPAKKSLATATAVTEVDKEKLNADEVGFYLKIADELEHWISSIRSHAHQQLEGGQDVTGYKLVPKQARRRWSSVTEAEQMFERHGIAFSEFMDSKLISPAKAKRVLKANGIDADAFEMLIVATSSGSSLVPQDDPRPAITDTIRNLEV